MNVLILIALLSLPIDVEAEEMCGRESYDTLEEPNFDCPSPGEVDLLPDLRPPDSIPIEAGVEISAPWEGALVHRDKLVEVGSRIKTLRRLRWLDRLQVLTEYQIQLEYQEGVCNANINHANERIKIYQEALSRANSEVDSSRVWYKTFWFGYTIGVISASLIVALSAYILTVL